MGITGLSLISNFRKPGPRDVVSRQHLTLNGINKRVFLNQWGEPDIKINLDRLMGFYRKGSLFLKKNPSKGTHYSVWIYKKRDAILFFNKKKLTLHFKWSKFKERSEAPRPQGGASES